MGCETEGKRNGKNKKIAANFPAVSQGMATAPIGRLRERGGWFSEAVSTRAATLPVDSPFRGKTANWSALNSLKLTVRRSREFSARRRSCWQIDRERGGMGADLERAPCYFHCSHGIDRRSDRWRRLRTAIGRAQRGSIAGFE